MKIIAWNVNGIRAVYRKVDLAKFLKDNKPDIMCFNETKCNGDIKNKIMDEYFKYRYWNCSQTRKGYSGTAIFSKTKPLKDPIISPFDKEGRFISMEYEKFILICVYTPNSKPKLKRVDYRTKEWDKKVRNYVKKQKKPVILCCDMNVAHCPIDIYSTVGKDKEPGYSPQERASFDKLLKNDLLIDTFRKLHPKEVKYSYWSYRTRARKRNAGWRLDYFLVSKKIMSKVKKSDILTGQLGSDHAPIVLKIF